MTREEIEAALDYYTSDRREVFQVYAANGIAALRALLRALPVLEAAKEYALWQERFDNCYDMLDFGDCECQEYMTETRKALIAAIREHDREGT
jgi:hypothetical protein